MNFDPKRSHLNITQEFVLLINFSRYVSPILFLLPFSLLFEIDRVKNSSSLAVLLLMLPLFAYLVIESHQLKQLVCLADHNQDDHKNFYLPKK